MLKRYLLTLACALFISTGFAQETTEIKRKLSENVTEIFTVLKTDINMRQGAYKALYKRKQPVATGAYDKDKKVGLWTFTNPKGVVMQTYDYSHNRLFYEAPEDTTSSLRYFVDKELKAGDKITKPVKIGGRYYGYLPYLSLFSLPDGYRDIDRDQVVATVVLLISPFGRLADYKVNLIGVAQIEPFKIVNMNIKLPDPADVIFTPATLNGEPIASRIVIKCYVTGSGHLDFED